MKKKYMTPQMTEEEVKNDFVLRPPVQGSNGGTGSILVKERDEETGDSPIWGDNGRLW